MPCDLMETYTANNKGPKPEPWGTAQQNRLTFYPRATEAESAQPFPKPFSQDVQWSTVSKAALTSGSTKNRALTYIKRHQLSCLTATLIEIHKDLIRRGNLDADILEGMGQNGLHNCIFNKLKLGLQRIETRPQTTQTLRLRLLE